MKFKITLLTILLIGLAACKNDAHHSDHDHKHSDSLHIDEKAVMQKESFSELKERLMKEGYQIFDYVDERSGDSTLMQQYFIAFLKRGPVRDQPKEVTDSLQKLHMEHLGRMYYEGYASISGPFGDDGDIRGITIYNVPTLKMADSLANMDPMVKAGRLVIEVHPWWAAKGFPLR
ncbi:YciI family protein [Constantimarinum furrinae]|uniref:Phenylalanyl-tRNA synthetase subunit alpha n=1 Tax=Constantimarinum furrinae TaxID=2562285 RepID=A0A7G8PTB6_9FLAO|nr:hypothetical protein [Constantimarinum furrinae]QNJ97582.1 Phenylalanyl-tRNA synthetase subunit alpha [Constantimarinum furrinae]